QQTEEPTMSKTTRYPYILDITLAVLIRSEPGEAVTRALVDRALAATSNFPPGAESFGIVLGDLDRAHLIGDDGCLTPLADRYAAMWGHRGISPKEHAKG